MGDRLIVPSTLAKKSHVMQSSHEYKAGIIFDRSDENLLHNKIEPSYEHSLSRAANSEILFHNLSSKNIPTNANSTAQIYNSFCSEARPTKEQNLRHYVMPTPANHVMKQIAQGYVQGMDANNLIFFSKFVNYLSSYK